MGLEHAANDRSGGPQQSCVLAFCVLPLPKASPGAAQWSEAITAVNSQNPTKIWHPAGETANLKCISSCYRHAAADGALPTAGAGSALERGVDHDDHTWGRRGVADARGAGRAAASGAPQGGRSHCIPTFAEALKQVE